MAQAAVKFLLDNLKELLSYHIHLIRDAVTILKQLENDLRPLKIYLDRYSNVLKNEELFLEWERQVKKAVYEVEDAVDSYVTQAVQKHSRTFRGDIKETSSLENEVNYLREKKVRPVIDKAKIVFANIPIRNASNTYAEEVIRDTRRKRNKAFRKKNVVGFEDETKKLINCLSKESNKLEVICITGMSGIGKTTLARKIYCDPTIQYKFPTLIWISFSQDNNIKDALLTILKFTQQDISNESVDDLAELVYEYLRTEKFLIFIDDVRTVDVWTKIQAFLPKSNKMGKVLITSRFEKVARHASLKSNRHELQLQDHNKSWDLLQFEIYGTFKYTPELEEDWIYMNNKYHWGLPLAIKGTNKCPPELEHVGKYMANLCGGLPLAIKVIGGVLANTFSKEDFKSEWRKLYEDLKAYLLQGEGDNEERLEMIISWSYYKLPYKLRDCFLYLGMFPEDTEIPASKLTKLWIAEGFISGNNLEETARNNLKDLISRNLVMVEKTKRDGEVKTCLIHDTVREFCQKIARHEDQNLFEELRKSKEGAIESPMRKIQKFRRLCIHSYDHDFFLKTKGVSHVRSFLSFSKTPIKLEFKDNSSIIDSFELLRVFDVNAKFLEFPAKFTQLVHLRYLSLSGDELKILPEAISILWNLQTLTVNTLSRTLNIQANVWSLLQLRHVKTKAAIILDNLGRGDGGENLQTFTRLSPQSCKNDVFDKAKNLKTLGIRGPLITIIHSNCLEKLERLEKLKLVNDVFPIRKSENPLQDIPLRFLPKIRVLTLSATYLNWACMSTLGKHSTLKVLKLKDNAFAGEYWDAVPEGFHQLESLYISRTDLQVWRASNDSFPKLRTLVLEDCDKLEGVPTEIGMNLVMLSLKRVTKYLISSAIQIKEKRDMAKEQKETKWGELELIIAPGDAPLDHKY